MAVDGNGKYIGEGPTDLLVSRWSPSSSDGEEEEKPKGFMKRATKLVRSLKKSKSTTSMAEKANTDVPPMPALPRMIDSRVTSRMEPAIKYINSPPPTPLMTSPPSMSSPTFSHHSSSVKMPLFERPDSPVLPDSHPIPKPRSRKRVNAANEQLQTSVDVPSSAPPNFPPPIPTTPTVVSGRSFTEPPSKPNHDRGEHSRRAFTTIAGTQNKYQVVQNALGAERELVDPFSDQHGRSPANPIKRKMLPTVIQQTGSTSTLNVVQEQDENMPMAQNAITQAADRLDFKRVMDSVLHEELNQGHGPTEEDISPIDAEIAEYLKMKVTIEKHIQKLQAKKDAERKASGASLNSPQMDGVRRVMASESTSSNVHSETPIVVTTPEPKTHSKSTQELSPQDLEGTNTVSNTSDHHNDWRSPKEGETEKEFRDRQFHYAKALLLLTEGASDSGNDQEIDFSVFSGHDPRVLLPPHDPESLSVETPETDKPPSLESSENPPRDPAASSTEELSIRGVMKLWKESCPSDKQRLAHQEPKEKQQTNDDLGRQDVLPNLSKQADNPMTPSTIQHRSGLAEASQKSIMPRPLRPSDGSVPKKSRVLEAVQRMNGNQRPYDSVLQTESSYSSFPSPLVTEKEAGAKGSGRKFGFLRRDEGKSRSVEADEKTSKLYIGKDHLQNTPTPLAASKSTGALLKYEDFGIKPPPMIVQGSSIYRRKYGLPSLEPRKPEDNRRHPSHIFPWQTLKLSCADHEGQCSLCGVDCCLLRHGIRKLNKTEPDESPQPKRKLQSMVTDLQAQAPKVFDVFSRMVHCSHCRRKICPDCAGRCDKGLCQIVTCKSCAGGDPWTACACYQGGHVEDKSKIGSE